MEISINENTMVAVVLAVLVLVSLMQAFQLNAMSATLSQLQASAGSVAQSSTSGSANAQQSGIQGLSLPSGLQSLPQQVGGC